MLRPRPHTIGGLTLLLVRRRPRLAAAALGATACVALAGVPSAPEPSPRRGPWIASFRGDELIADDAHLFWTEARDREYDDRPVGIAASAVRRRAHAGGAVETVFDFERDDTYCFVGALRFLGRRPAWHCRRPILDALGRADPSRYLRDTEDGLRGVPAPWAPPRKVAATGDEVIFVVTGPTRLLHLDAVTGELRRGVELPTAFNAFSVELAGVTGDAIVGTATDAEGPVVWSAPRAGGPVTTLFRPLRGSAIDAVLADERGVFVSWDEDWGSCHLARLEAGRAREIHRTTSPIRGLLRDGEHLYFHTGDAILRARLGASGTQVLLRGAHPDLDRRTMAVGGGWVYWRDFGALYRHRLPPR